MMTQSVALTLGGWISGGKWLFRGAKGSEPGESPRDPCCSGDFKPDSTGRSNDS